MPPAGGLRISAWARGFPHASEVKNPSAMQKTQETWVRSLGREDPLEQEMATHSSIPAWEIPDQRSLVGYSPGGRKEWDTTEQLSTHAHLGCRRSP